MKKIGLIISAVAVCALLTACGITQEEYDAVVSERDELSEEVENYEKALEFETKLAEYRARVEEQYEADEFIIYVIEKGADYDMSEYQSQLDEIYAQITASFELEDSLNGTDGILTESEYIDNSESYDEAIDTIDTMYEAWNNLHESIQALKDYMMK